MIFTFEIMTIIVPTVGFTKCDGLQVDGMQEMGEQCPL